MNDEFKTKDLFLAAFLVASGQTLLRTDFEGTICWFVFDSYVCDRLVQSYWNGTDSCSARDYANALRNLKDIIFSAEPRRRRDGTRNYLG